MWSGRGAPRPGSPTAHAPEQSDDPFPGVHGQSPPMRELKRHMQAVACDRDVTVLILGASGTGKERVARAIHDASPRSDAPFIPVNCAGLAPTLIEDELFGHVRGAFTGAVDSRPGPFERAAGGTLLLDEIGDLAPELQMKLLRVLQERRVQRLGSTRESTIDVRIIAATNADLARATAEGRFREDLFYRLKVFVLRVPPLAERGRGDIEILARAILEQLARRRRRPPPRLHSEALDWLVQYGWPGNVRELENTLECMIVAAGSEPLLTAAHLPPEFDAPSLSRHPGTVAMRRPRARPLPTRAEALAALEAADFKRGRAAAALGLSRHQLYRLLRRESGHGPTRP